jgi:glycosyltransferase involved in cell wall biosynthesis
LLRNKIWHIAEKVRPELIFSVGSVVGWLSLLAGKKLSIPTVVDVHGLVGAEVKARKEKDWKLFYRRENEAFQESDRLIVVGALMKKVIQKAYGVPERKIIVAHNGADIRGEKAKYELPLKVIYAGTFYPFVDGYLEIAKSANHDRFEFFLMGRGVRAREKTLFRRIRDEKISINCLGYKPRKEALAIMATMNVGVMPSDNNIARTIGFPIKVLDCMSLGLPVIVSKAMEISKVVEEEGCGFVAESMCEYLEALDLLVDEPVWSRQSLNGTRAVKLKYNWDTVLSPLEGVLRSLS